MARPSHTRWLDCFTKLTNREMRALYSFGFTAVQLEVVLYILAQTRGTGRIMAGELDDAEWDEWQEARDSYGRETAQLYRGTIAAGIERHDKQVARELRRLIAAGVVIEHEAGHKGKAAVLSVDLDPEHWRRYPLSGTRALPKTTAQTASPTTSGNPTAPKAGSAEAPESAGFGSSDAPLFKRRKGETEELCSFEQETRDSGESRPFSIDQIKTPQLRELARRLLDRADDQPEDVTGSTVARPRRGETP